MPALTGRHGYARPVAHDTVTESWRQLLQLLWLLLLLPRLLLLRRWQRLLTLPLTIWQLRLPAWEEHRIVLRYPCS